MFELKLTEINIKMAGLYNLQSKAEFDKNFKRVKDIITKSDVDQDKAIRLERTQANLIKDDETEIVVQGNSEEVYNIFILK